ncbi:hypothetical protein CEUSTIGMA_g2288.t1 [Chlamydomonas eustigma]|uniref:Uncharacterized protein n=1 Tax=Chlamydomonas eustigma TaxID=1157962 RepID=A0A250WW43_9CHLO|nr:hypothetical protein CEUSTIGMA_g2288.t1 [Chlamydomonas eustigma]|eukprot:GAX74842.1 hypothetical protein CEUSTIGMA_g2288.t1 [Chlamydomonas eustigma]
MVSRLGHGPFMNGYWPFFPFKQFFYDTRPDLCRQTTKQADWQKLRSQWRFLQALFCYLGPPSHVLFNIKWPVLCVMLVCALHQKRLDGLLVGENLKKLMDYAYRYSTFAMSLLLAFRINRTYERWKEARASMAAVVNGLLNLFSQAATWIRDPVMIDLFRRFCILWAYAMKQALTNTNSLEPAALSLLHPEELSIYSGSKKGRQVVVTMLRELISQASLNSDQFRAMEDVIQATQRSGGDALRHKSQALPQGVSLMCSGIVQIWCLLLPIALINPTYQPGSTSVASQGNGYFASFDWLGSVISLTIAVMLMGCDEMASQLEDPFDMMPLDEIVLSCENDINRVEKELSMLREAIKLAKIQGVEKLMEEGGEKLVKRSAMSSSSVVYTAAATSRTLHAMSSQAARPGDNHAAECAVHGETLGTAREDSRLVRKGGETSSFVAPAVRQGSLYYMMGLGGGSVMRPRGSVVLDQTLQTDNVPVN